MNVKSLIAGAAIAACALPGQAASLIFDAASPLGVGRSDINEVRF